MNNFAVYTGLLWLAVLMYIIAGILNAYGIIFRKENVERNSYRTVYAGLLIHSIGIGFWWTITGHGPYITRNEVLVSDAWIMISVFLVFKRYFPVISRASIIIIPATFLAMALGIFFAPEIRTLTPIFTSIWLIFHISFFKIALGSLLIALAFSIFYILKTRTKSKWLQSLPELKIIDLYAYRFSGFGFIFWAVAVLAGSIWAHQSWGRYWGWDPVETWALIAWVFWGFYLHMRRFFNWSGEKAAYLLIACFTISLIALFYTSHLETAIHLEYFK
ncbi:MAG: cytochrome c biogenesis protein CcsA [Nitrospirae bacterium]|nr:cytochrome c biogenesis protein CcsA [Nitrospirota bacterium]